MLSSLAVAALVSLSTAFPFQHGQRHAGGVSCPITLDGRVPLDTTLHTFDTTASPFNPDYSKGQNLSWSQIIKLPSVTPSKFDVPNDKAIEVTISDQSIFVPGGGQQQLGFRRAGLLMGNGTDASNVGVETFHWSVKQDPAMKLNLTHEYMNVWHETNAYDANQFSFNTGIMLSQDYPKTGNVTNLKEENAKNDWKFQNRNNDIVWSTRISESEWQNFAVTLDYVKNTLQIYYSRGNDLLHAVTEPLPNDNSGGGQFQLGIAKKPTETVSVVYDGYQEPNLHEGQIYGGIFIEDSTGGCISM